MSGHKEINKCPNSLNGKHRPVQNAVRTHYVCENCTKLIELIPKEKREPAKSW